MASALTLEYVTLVAFASAVANVDADVASAALTVTAGAVTDDIATLNAKTMPVNWFLSFMLFLRFF